MATRPIGPTPKYDNGVSGNDVCLLDGMHSDTRRLEQRTLFERNSVRQLEQDAGRSDVVFRERSPYPNPYQPRDVQLWAIPLRQ